MIERSFTFQGQLVWSEGTMSDNKDIATHLLGCIPLAMKVERAQQADDKKGIDYWVTLQSGRMVGVDVKVRDVDWSKKGYDDLALESWSVMEKKIIGWTRDANKQTDYILWLWKDTGRYTLLPFPWLCSIFMKYWEAWHKKYKTAIQRTDNSPSSQWHSECIFVPRELVWRKIYATCGGTPDAR